VLQEDVIGFFCNFNENEWLCSVVIVVMLFLFLLLLLLWLGAEDLVVVFQVWKIL